MNQEPPWQPREQPDGQRLLGQQQWKQDLPPSQLAVYNQLSLSTPDDFQGPSLNNVAPPKRPSGIWQWYQSRTKKVKLSIVCGMILAMLLFFSCIAAAVESVNPGTQPAPTPTISTHQAALVMSTTVPTLPTPTSIPMTTATSMPKPALALTNVPQPPQTPTPCPAVNCNPWGYNFIPGNFIYSPPSAFCTYFSCVNTFLHGHGYVVECQDGEYSKSGGFQSVCANHGGVMRPLYSH